MESVFKDSNNNNMIMCAREDVRHMKRNMTLDFDAPQANKKAKFIKTCILESPDLKMLKLGSPELEGLLMQNGLASATPTPGVLPNYFLKNETEVTEEQEQYARGFEDALNQLHQMNNNHIKPNQYHHNNDNHTRVMVTNGDYHSNNNNNINNHMNNNNIITTNGLYSMSANIDNSGHHLSVPITTSSAVMLPITSSSALLPPTTSSSNLMPPTSSSANALPPISTAALDVSGLTPPLSPPQQLAPIDMAKQEMIKLERKRLRNRIAASKCRRRKLERISRLEDKVKALKGENSELSVVVNKLRDQVCSLKQQVMDHVKCGCQLVVPQ